MTTTEALNVVSAMIDSLQETPPAFFSQYHRKKMIRERQALVHLTQLVSYNLRNLKPVPKDIAHDD